ncbi:MAG: arginine N-succinyltransferase [Saccharospirillaceae bacterium]|nr:arginine N-succinyltransferase [Thalassolituus sp. HI0120]MCH2040821.1 arginine N-succinyltransferase [Saccharospirillaceae bacterium]
MLIVRPVKGSDIDDLLSLAIKAGPGMTSFPADRKLLQRNIETSINSFSHDGYDPQDFFWLALNDTKRNKVVGCAAIFATTGNRQAFYSYRLISLSHHSHALEKQVRVDMLQLTNDYTDCSEVGTLFVDPEYRGNGHWLARCRYLLMGKYPERFNTHVIAELRGRVDKTGYCPFWQGLGRHFFQMDFTEADRLCAAGSNQFITELMPRQPIYTCLLPQETRDAIGKPNDAGIRAKELLHQEGFHFEQVIDIFDGGPLLRCKVSELNSVKNMHDTTLSQIDNNTQSIISNGGFCDFRATLNRQAGQQSNDAAEQQSQQCASLNLLPEDTVVVIPETCRKTGGTDENI